MFYKITRHVISKAEFHFRFPLRVSQFYQSALPGDPNANPGIRLPQLYLPMNSPFYQSALRGTLTLIPESDCPKTPSFWNNFCESLILTNLIYFMTLKLILLITNFQSLVCGRTRSLRVVTMRNMTLVVFPGLQHEWFSPFLYERSRGKLIY